MKKKALSSVGLVLGGCLWFAISGYGGPGHDHGSKKSAVPEAVEAVADFVLNDEVKAKLDLEVGAVEMPDIPGSNATVIAVPVGAISNPSKSGSATVFFTEDSGEDGTAQKFAALEVEIGETKNGYVEIISGLLPGDVVIVKNAARIGEKAVEDVAKNPAEPTGEQPQLEISTPISEPSKMESEQVAAAKTPVKPAVSDQTASKKAEACDTRCPFETQVPETFCPNDTSHANKDSSHCDRDDYRRKSHSRHYSGRHW